MALGKDLRTAAALILVAGLGIAVSVAARRREQLIPPGTALPLQTSQQADIRDAGEAVIIRVARQATPAVVAGGD